MASRPCCCAARSTTPRASWTRTPTPTRTLRPLPARTARAARRSPRSAAHPAASAAHGALRAARAPARDHDAPRPLPRRAGARAARRLCRAFDPAARAAAHRGGRDDLRPHRTRGGLAGRRRRLAGHRPRARVVPASSSAAASRPACRVRQLWRTFPPARVVLFDTSPAQLADVCAPLLPARLRVADCVAIATAPACSSSTGRSTGRSRGAIRAASTPRPSTSAARSRRSPPPRQPCGAASIPQRPFVIVVQQSQFDPSRAPAGKHTGYAYCHVPAGSDVDCTDAIERQVERFAPGFRDRILARHGSLPRISSAHNPNYVGGAITGGVADLFQFFTRPGGAARPVLHAASPPVHLLGIDSAGWRRARHVRLLRRAECPAPPGWLADDVAGARRGAVSPSFGGAPHTDATSKIAPK